MYFRPDTSINTLNVTCQNATFQTQQVEHTIKKNFKLSLTFIHLDQKEKTKTKSLYVFNIYTHHLVYELCPASSSISLVFLFACLALLCLALLHFSSRLIPFRFACNSLCTQIRSEI